MANKITKNTIHEMLQAKADEFVKSPPVGIIGKTFYVMAENWLLRELEISNNLMKKPVLKNLIANKRDLTLKEATLISRLFGLEDTDIVPKCKGYTYPEEKIIALKGYTNPLNNK